MLPSDLPSHLDSSVISYLAAPFAHETREWVFESLSSTMRHPSVPTGKTLINEASRSSDGSRARRSRNLVCWKIPLQFPSTRQPATKAVRLGEIERSTEQRREIRAGERRCCARHLADYNTTTVLGFAKKSQLNGRWASARPLNVHVSDGAGTQAHAKKGKHERLQQLS